MSGRWLVATVVLGRPAPAADPYPHVCGITVAATRSGQPYRYQRRDCAACHQRSAGGPG
ncbi:hypothetical protein AB0C02_30500 [Micromonospora sp. NPDC048999]|uniref:hypothetical protein n=1 Tax=Micromonospora sp. NPDC048999 TaxID=3155391 RepID=UPI0033EAD5C9